ncbi:uncharacterized protein EAE98_010327 [Botrytis deweyae]|uniref:Uncharacterized protein n=1 Tax=Botrytis deweyae TaxID=2478750 RepID=A0ABQ7I945_9HELO|nr:uncharacterized protein EAE98_010327 [Botrytis deweyae]KAF7917222.1 hypothetical protein EAE98_010327 [Botrytis deweyae]
MHWRRSILHSEPKSIVSRSHCSSAVKIAFCHGTRLNQVYQSRSSGMSLVPGKAWAKSRRNPLQSLRYLSMYTYYFSIPLTT